VPAKSRPATRRPGAAGRLRAQADGIEEVKRQEVLAAKRRLRIGFQIVLLAAIGLMVFTLIFPTLRLYMSQQVQKAELREQVQAAEQQYEDLEAARLRWEDPAYVKAQARDRLSFAMPGDRTFRVSDPENAPELQVAPPAEPPPTHLASEELAADDPPWYAKLWESTVAAGQADQP
jgi:cell division protein FtsB